jgi:hypothetical protein
VETRAFGMVAAGEKYGDIVKSRHILTKMMKNFIV